MRTCQIAAFLAASIILLFFVHKFGVNVPWGDEWDVLPLVEKLRSGSLTLSDLMARHNEHRIFLPRLAMLANAYVTGFNVKYLMYCSALMLVSVGWMCIGQFNKVSFSAPSRWLSLLLPFVLYHCRQYENLLWGFQIGFMASAACSVLALSLLHSSTGAAPRSRLAFALAVLAGAAASLSSSQGLLVWPAGLLVFFLAKETESRTPALVWGGGGVAFWVPYFVGVQHLTSAGNGPSLLHRPFSAVKFLADLTGNSLVWGENGAPLLGGALLLLVVAVFWRTFRSGIACELRFWAALAVFSLLVLIAITAGRAGLVVNHAHESRYITFSLLFTVSVWVITLRNAVDLSRGASGIMTALLGLLLLVAVPCSYVEGWRNGLTFLGRQEGARFLLKNYRRVPDEGLRELYLPNGAVVRERAVILERLHHAAFLD